MRTLAFRPPDLTSTGITARSVLLALTLSLGATGCVTEPVSAKCDPSNCTGCCLGEVCEAGTTVFACGTAGQACALCSNNQVCSGTCTTLTGGGGGGGGSSCDGGTNAALCAEARASCGPLQVIDVCGQQRSITSCGTCAANQACTNGTCACVPETDQQFCARQGRACGAASGLDNCGVSRSVSSCGSCVSGNACTAGVCACAGETNAQFCTRLGASCGATSGTDACGNPRSVASCGTCNSFDVCQQGACVCQAPTDAEFCAAAGRTCGTYSDWDDCGTFRTANCGSCTGSQQCNSAGACVCSPETEAALCTALGKNCGTLTTTDRCGTSRTISCNLITCAAPQSCGGGGVPNVCGCTDPEAAFCARAYRTCGPLTRVDACGQQRTVASCGTCGALEACEATGNCARSEPSTPVCGGGFCWENPLPVGTTLTDACTSPQGSQWVVGESGTALQWNGSTWRGWFALTNQNLAAVWAVSDSDVWAVGAAGTVLHFDGTTWALQPVGSTVNLRGVWVSGAGIVWVVGDGGLVLRRSANTWAAQTVPTTVSLNAVTGAGARVWAVGAQGVVLAFDGSAWAVSTPQSSWTLKDVVARSETDVWATSSSGVLRYTGTSWVSSTAARGGAIAASASAVWVSNMMYVETSGSVYRFDGLAWTSEAVATVPYLSLIAPNYELGGVTVGPGPDEVLVVGTNGAMRRRVGGSWVSANRGVRTLIVDDRETEQATMTGITADNGTVMAAGSYPRGTFDRIGGIYAERSDAGVWTATYTGGWLGTPAPRAPQSAWFAGSQLATLDAGVLSSLYFPKGATAVTATSPAEAWVVGGDTTTRFNGSAWVGVPNPVSGSSVALSSVAAMGPGDVWAVGTAGTILRYTSGAWQAATSPTTSDIKRVRARSGNRAVASGTFGVIRWDGAAWVTTTRTTSTTAVWPETSTTWWLGNNRELLFWDGTQFVNQAPWATTSTSLEFVDFASDGTSLWVLGKNGEVLRR